MEIDIDQSIEVLRERSSKAIAELHALIAKENELRAFILKIEGALEFLENCKQPD